MPETPSAVASINILGTNVHMAGFDTVVELMDHWIESEPDRVHHIVNTGMHGIMEAHRDSRFRSVLNSADLMFPDGILAIFIARLHGFRLRKADTGPGLMWRFSETGKHQGYRYYFFGDTENTLEILTSRLQKQFPKVKVVGYYSPPFRALTAEEDKATVDAINDAKPDVLWVGLGMPKQEWWIAEHRNSLKVPIAVGAGAALKFTSGTVSRAPSWLCAMGFEWAWRLLQEPKRVWRRVLIDAPQFIGLVFLQLTRLKRYG